MWLLMNLQLGSELLKIHYSKISVMHGVKHTVYIFFIDISETPVVDQMSKAHKEIYNLFDSGIYQKTHYIFKSK